MEWLVIPHQKLINNKKYTFFSLFLGFYKITFTFLGILNYIVVSYSLPVQILALHGQISLWCCPCWVVFFETVCVCGGV